MEGVTLQMELQKAKAAKAKAPSRSPSAHRVPRGKSSSALLDGAAAALRSLPAAPETPSGSPERETPRSGDGGDAA